jgi:hypothetical protein
MLMALLKIAISVALLWVLFDSVDAGAVLVFEAEGGAQGPST